MTVIIEPVVGRDADLAAAKLVACRPEAYTLESVIEAQKRLTEESCRMIQDLGNRVIEAERGEIATRRHLLSFAKKIRGLLQNGAVEDAAEEIEAELKASAKSSRSPTNRRML